MENGKEIKLEKFKKLGIIGLEELLKSYFFGKKC